MIQNFYLQNFTNQIVPEVEEIRYSNLFKFQHDKMQMLSDFQLNEVRTKFCMCFESNYCCCQVLTNCKPVKSDPLPKIYSLVRVARVKSINFNNNFQNLIEALDMIYDPNELKVIGKRKGENRRNGSHKRTSYIGVSKNGPNWQALISINKKKTYIGTFMTERECARAFDFYSLLLHSFQAVTNFNYTKSDVIQLIKDFKHLI